MMEALLALQKIELSPKPRTAEQAAEAVRLRGLVPAPVLGHFDRLLARGKNGVAAVRNGACGACHIRLPSGSLARLANPEDLHLCDSCGRYLYLPEDEPLGAVAAPTTSTTSTKAKPSARKRVRKADVNAA